jgi:DNA-binding HxlR family transcriptional regulator
MKKRETFCPIRDIIARLGDKWALLVLLQLEEQGVMRFFELRHAIPDVSEKVLTSTLRTLEQMHLLGRRVYPEVPPRVEYSLTDLAGTLLPIVHPLIAWALQHQDECLPTHR